MPQYKYEFLTEQDEKPFFTCYCERERAQVLTALKNCLLTFRIRKTELGTRKTIIESF